MPLAPGPAVQSADWLGRPGMVAGGMHLTFWNTHEEPPRQGPSDPLFRVTWPFRAPKLGTLQTAGKGS